MHDNGLFGSLSVHVQRLVHHFWITWFIKMFTFTFSAHHFFFKHNNQLISKAFCSEKYTFACSALTLTGSMQCLRRTTFFSVAYSATKKTIRCYTCGAKRMMYLSESSVIFLLCLRRTYPNRFDAVPATHNVFSVAYSATKKTIRCYACGAKRMMYLFWVYCNLKQD